MCEGSPIFHLQESGFARCVHIDWLSYNTSATDHTLGQVGHAVSHDMAMRDIHPIPPALSELCIANLEAVDPMSRCGSYLTAMCGACWVDGRVRVHIGFGREMRAGPADL